VRVTTVPDAESAAQRAAERVARLVAEALDARGVAHVALAGGSTPRRCNELLAELVPDFAGVQLWLSDERCVAADDADANFRMVRESLLDRADVPAENVHRVAGELGPDPAAERYEDEIRAHVRTADDAGVPVFDVIMCGMGEDGHTLSLFPGNPAAAERSRLVVGVRGAPKPPPERVSFTFALTDAARHTFLLVAGASKAEALASVLEGPDPHVPASLLRAGHLEVIADDAAAPGRPGERG
jgi:6-phosphogluconolactonase